MENNKLTNILRKHGSKFILAFLILGCVFVWGNRLIRLSRTNSSQDFQTLHNTLDCYFKGETLSLESLTALENIVQRHPELHPKCDALLTHAFFCSKNIPKGLVYAKSTLDRVKNDLPEPYLAFSETSLMIAKGNCEGALKEAQVLHNQIKDSKDLDTLKCINMLRILCLSKWAKQDVLTTPMWHEFKSHPSFQKISSFFKEGGVTLEDYLAA